MNRNDLDEQGQKTLWISWSRLSEWERCNQKAIFHMERKGPTIKEGRNFVSGTVADRAMRKWLEQPEPHLIGEMAQYVDELWDEYTNNSTEYNVTWKDPQDQINAKETAKECVIRLEPFLLNKVLPFEYQAEWRFQLQIKIPDINPGLKRSVVLNGGADIVVRNPDTGEHFIYDLKTTRNENYVVGSTLAQLIYYQIALSIAEGIPADLIKTAFVTPLTKIQFHPLEITLEDRRLLLTRIAQMAQSVWRKDVPTLTADINDCFFCDVKSLCPRFCIPVKETNGKKTVTFADAASLRREAKERTE